MTNRESWTLCVALYDDDTGDPIDLTIPAAQFDEAFGTDFLTGDIPVVSIQFEVRRAGPRVGSGEHGGGYGPYYDFGSGYGDGPILTASIGNGITIIDSGVFQVYFSETSMRKLYRGTYDVGCVLTSADGIDARQLFRGRLPIFDGFVTT